jgi:hypothetical protein
MVRGRSDPEPDLSGLADYDPEYPNIFREAGFLPAHIYDPATFQNLSGMNGRTFRDSLSWLLDNGLVIPTIDVDGLEGGYLMPFRPGRHAPDIKRKVAEAELEQAYAKASPGAKRSLTAAIRRKRLNDAGHSIYHREMLGNHETCKRQ